MVDHLQFLGPCSAAALLCGSLHAQTPNLYFDGEDDRVTLPNGVLSTIGSLPFTVEAWVRGVESEQVTHPRILSNRDMIDNGFMFGFHGAWGGSSYKMLCMQLDGLNYILINNGSYNGSILDGTCHHVAVSKGVDSLRFYVDGVHIGSKVLQGVPSAGTIAASMLIGDDGPDPQPFNGNISQVRLWDHMRTQAEIAAAMNSSIPGTTPGLMGYWELNEGAGQSILDAAGGPAGVLGTSTDAEVLDPTWESDGCPVLDPSSGNCLLFDGEDDRVTLPNGVLSTIGSLPFTVEAWVRGVESEQVTHPRILSNRDMIDNGFMFGFHGAWGGSSYKMLCMQLDGLNYILINNGSYNGSILDGTCHHVAVSKGVDSLRFYVDGVHIGSKVLHGVPSAGTIAASMLIGDDGPDPQPFNGNISQVRLWDHVRTQAEIAAAMNSSISGTTPGLMGYWELNEGAGQSISDAAGGPAGVLGEGTGLDDADPQWMDDCCALDPATAAPDLSSIPSATIIHPLPVQDVLYVQLDGFIGPTDLVVMDARGSIVLSSRSAGRPNTVLDLSSLPAGVYVLRILSGTSMIAERFMKN